MMKKRLLSMVVLSCLLTSVAMPAYGASAPSAVAEQPTADGLTEAIEKAKLTLSIDSAVWDDFTYNSYQSEYGLRWSLDWSQSADSEQHLSATIDSQGTVLSYYAYRPLSTSGLAAIRQDAAQQTADAFLRQVAADYADTLSLAPQNSSHQSGDTFSFSYRQQYQGIPVYNGLVTIGVNKYSGSVTNFSVSNAVNTAGISWPSKSRAISQSRANTALLNEIGVEMVYLSRYDYASGEYSVYPAYQLSDQSLVIDALTGKAISLTTDGIAPYAANESAADAGGSARSTLSPKELAAVESMGALISRDDAAAKLQQAMGISGYTVQQSALTTLYNEKERYIWRLSLTAKTDDERHLSGTVDAQSGQVLSFYQYNDALTPLDTPHSSAEADRMVNAFLQQVAPTELKECSLVPQTDRKSGQTEYYYSYERLVNGIAFPDNGISVSYNAATGRIESYQLNWNRTVTFPDITTAKSAQAICADMVKGGEFRLMYQRTAQDYRLVYDFADKSAMRFDPFTGERIDWQGKPYIPQTMPTYQWQGTASESGTRLYENGIYLNKTTLSTDQTLTQNDLAVLLYRSRYPYADVTNSQAIYDELANLQLIPAAEAAPHQIMTRQDCARYAIRMLGYERLTSHPELFVYPYADACANEYKASVAMAGALGLLTNDGSQHIRPTENITLGEAFDLIYRALQQ